MRGGRGAAAACMRRWRRHWRLCLQPALLWGGASRLCAALSYAANGSAARVEAAKVAAGVEGRTLGRARGVGFNAALCASEAFRAVQNQIRLGPHPPMTKQNTPAPGRAPQDKGCDCADGMPSVNSSSPWARERCGVQEGQ